jgi:hypothetical protein
MGLVTAVSEGCAARSGTAAGNQRPRSLDLLGEFVRAAGVAYPSLAAAADRFGSISGLAVDPRSGEWVSVIDDREDTRLAWLSIDFKGERLEVAPLRMQRLRAGAGVADRVATQADLEGVTVLADGTLIVAEEGHERDGELWQPALLRLTADGVVTQVIDFPPAYRIIGDTSGVRSNQGFESVTSTPDGRLIAGLEQPLIQDGQVSFDRPGRGRLVEFVPSGDTFRPGREWTYMLAATPRVSGLGEVCADGQNGLVELVALTNTRLLALERACLLIRPETGTTESLALNPIRIYSVDLSSNPVRKSLLLDLSSIRDRLPPELARLENFEAMAFGPPVGGARTLLIASDDNFRKTQKTAFLLFALPR